MGNFLNESKSDWGGYWTEKKLEAIAKYVVAYLKIMKKNPYWQTIYFDGFAGSGNKYPKNKSLLYKQLPLIEQEEKVYKGAAERILRLPENLSFTYHYFVDKNQESLDKLRGKIKGYEKYKEFPFQFRACDCNKELLNLAKAMHLHKNKYAALLLLDPFGMQIKWDSIQSLQDTRTDIWILVPTGVIVNRLLDKEGELKHLEKLKSFFGMDEEEIRNFFYETKQHKGLFGSNEAITKVSDPIRKIAELYIQQLGNIWKYVTEEPLVLLNSRNVPIFHFVFASNNKTALNIAKQIIGKS